MSDSYTDPQNEIQKWICEYCTYENFPSSLKCTMCKGSKPLLNEDIFRLSPTHTPSPRNALIESEPESEVYSGPSQQSLKTLNSTSVPSCAIDTPKLSSNNQLIVNNTVITNHTLNSTTVVEKTISTKQTIDKWPCTNCAYLNSTRDSRCSQCRTPATNISDQLNALNLRGSIPDLSTTLCGATMRSSSIGSTTNISTCRSNVTRVNSPIENNSHCSNKWSCPVCTYENWPKSLKCSMCAYQKENVMPESTDKILICDTKLSPESDIQIDENCAGNFIPTSKGRLNRPNPTHRNIYQSSGGHNNNLDSTNESILSERRIRHLRRQPDYQWLNACIGVVENNYSAVEMYLKCGGNPGRSLTSSEVALLNRNSAFDVGHTLIHLAIRFHREEMLPMLLARISGSGPGIKRVPSYVAPDLAADIRRHFATSLRIRKGNLNCHYINEHATFALPAEIEELPISVQEQLFEELLDRDAQKQLEMPPPALNWSLEITARLGSKLVVLWNRSAGDCLLDSAMQSTWGVFDRDNVLRRALADSLHQCSHIFYSRWREYEMVQAASLQFTLEEAQWEEDWSTLLSLASQPGSSLEQLHIFALSHILRRPIIVYGVKFVKSFRGEDIGYARFEGLYLPILWEQSFCIRSPIALGYTRGHFSALVPTEPYSRIEQSRDQAVDVTFLPLMDCEHKLLPIHFLTQSELGREETIMRQWLDVCVTEGGLLVAQQKLHKRPLLVAQMLEEWLNHYRRIAQVMRGPFSHRPKVTGYSSDGDSDEE